MIVKITTRGYTLSSKFEDKETGCWSVSLFSLDSMLKYISLFALEKSYVKICICLTFLKWYSKWIDALVL